MDDANFKPTRLLAILLWLV